MSGLNINFHRSELSLLGRLKIRLIITVKSPMKYLAQKAQSLSSSDLPHPQIPPGQKHSTADHPPPPLRRQGSAVKSSAGPEPGPRPPRTAFAESAKKVDALKAELAAKSSRIAGLEARVSLLEAENAGLRKAVSEGGFGRLEAGLGGSKQKTADIAGGHVMNHVIEVSDGEEDEMAVDVNVILDDDDVLITPRGNKCVAAARVISDSESEDGDENGQGHRDGDVGVTSSRKRAWRGVGDSESEDGSEGARVVNQKPGSPLVTTGIESEVDDVELYGTEGCSTPGTRPSARLTNSQSKRMRPTRRELEFFEPNNHEESEDDSEEDGSMEDFIDDSENFADSVEESSAGPEESGNEDTYEDVIARIRGKRNAKSKDWEIEAEMLSAFGEHPELCLKAVCALYRKQTEEEQAEKATILHNKKGFSQIDARRGSHIAQFLLDGDAAGPLKKTVQDLEKYNRHALKFCHKIALRYSKQLFAIYQKKEDPYFP
ncbi:uncharacterized protein LOC119292466 [Triticum dicoccoides]|uniref:uncharacterized protein LOC119292466 n=1 Tax=Triticum dicoccoides TaxID=85692 RepID=UPI00188FDE7E|nr:uncharacterized protein LOC119292466 [Triticum dicoccoides]